jgi:hypothetical protein
VYSLHAETDFIYLKGWSTFKLKSVSALTGEKELAIDTTQNP